MTAPVKITITKPFCVFVSEDTDFATNGLWVAQIVGADGLDFVTQASSPEVAVFMAWDVLRLVTERCGVDRAEHAFTRDAMFEDGTPARACAFCDVQTRADLCVFDHPATFRTAAPPDVIPDVILNAAPDIHVVPDDGVPIAVGDDGRCLCNCASPCPLGHVGAMERCLISDLETAGIAVVRQLPKKV